jgi:serine O-acetyltransferase
MGLFGRAISFLVDRLLFLLFAIDVSSFSINVRRLSIAHPVGVVLGGNGIRSHGTIVINAGVKFVGKSPLDPSYVAAHKSKVVFDLGHNVVIGANSVIVGPVRICDNVVIGAMSLVNSDIDEAGVYVGCPAKKISDKITNEWL